MFECRETGHRSARERRKEDELPPARSLRWRAQENRRLMHAKAPRATKPPCRYLGTLSTSLAAHCRPCSTSCASACSQYRTARVAFDWVDNTRVLFLLSRVSDTGGRHRRTIKFIVFLQLRSTILYGQPPLNFFLLIGEHTFF